MPRAARPTRCSVALITGALVLAAGAAHGAPVIAGATARKGTVDDASKRAFRRGADATLGGPKAQADPVALTRALSALEEGEAAYLELKLRPAEQALSEAFDGLLGSLSSLDDAEPAVRAALLLIQVRLARKRQAAAEQTVDRAVVALPGFPAGGQPPPEVQPLIDAARERLRGTLTAALSVVTTPPGAYIRINGVPTGRSPTTVSSLAPGTVRVTVQAGRRLVARTLKLKTGTQKVEIFAGPPAEESERLLAQLAEGDPQAAFKTAASLQSEHDAEFVCAALDVERRGVYVLRIDGKGERIAGAYRAPRPSDPEGWQALGRFCGQKAPTNTREAEARSIMRVKSLPPPPETGGDGLAWTLMAGGGAALAAGIWFGLAASDSADAYNTDGRNADKSDAVRSAAIADTAYVVSAGLVAAGIYLLSR